MPRESKIKKNVASATKENVKEDQEFCVKAGKLAEELSKQVYVVGKEVEQKLSNLSKSIYSETQRTLKGESTLCKSVSKQVKLSRLKHQKHELLVRLGDEVSHDPVERINKELLKFEGGDLNVEMFKNSLKTENELNKTILKALQRADGQLNDVSEKQLVNALNSVLDNPNLHSTINLKKLDLSPGIWQLIIMAIHQSSFGKTLDPEKCMRLNKALLETIFPRETAKILKKEKSAKQEKIDKLIKSIIEIESNMLKIRNE